MARDGKVINTKAAFCHHGDTTCLPKSGYVTTKLHGTSTCGCSVLCRIKMLPVVGHVHGFRETFRVRAATANVALTLMKYTHAYII